MNKELISNFIRDFCAVGKLRAKSEVRRRLNEILKSQRKEIVEEIEKIRSNTIGCGDVLDDLKNLITKEDITDNRRTT